MMARLNMSVKKRITVVSCFGARVLYVSRVLTLLLEAKSFGRDIVVVSVQIVHTGAFNSSNPTYDLLPWTIISQVALCTTIITSCTPYLRQLLETLPSGMYDIRHEQCMTDSRGYIMSDDRVYGAG